MTSFILLCGERQKCFWLDWHERSCCCRFSSHPTLLPLFSLVSHVRSQDSHFALQKKKRMEGGRWRDREPIIDVFLFPARGLLMNQYGSLGCWLATWSLECMCLCLAVSAHSVQPILIVHAWHVGRGTHPLIVPVYPFCWWGWSWNQHRLCILTWPTPTHNGSGKIHPRRKHLHWREAFLPSPTEW